MKSSTSKAKLFCIVAFPVISLSAFISIAMLVSTHMLIVYVIHPQQTRSAMALFDDQAIYLQL